MVLLHPPHLQRRKKARCIYYGEFGLTTWVASSKVEACLKYLAVWRMGLLLADIAAMLFVLVALVLFPTIDVISTRDILPKQLQHANLTLGMPALPSERSHARSMIVSPHVLNQIMQSWSVHLPAESLLLVCRGVIDTCSTEEHGGTGIGTRYCRKPWYR